MGSKQLTVNSEQKALRLSCFTVGYNILEGLVSVAAGVWAGSIALVGFGLDSFIESLSGSVMIWRFRNSGKRSDEEKEAIERKAVRLVAYSFFILAGYVFCESVKKLWLQEPVDPSLLGIIVAVISLVVMPALFFLKYRLGKSMGSRSLVADSKETLACMMLSAALLLGLGANYLFGFWQADPLAGLVIVALLVKEGIHILKEEALCNC